MEQSSRNFKLFSSNREFWAAFASPNRYFTENSRWVGNWVGIISGAVQADRAEQRLRMCRDGRGLGSKLVSFAKGFSKHLHILAIIKVDSEYLRFSFKAKVDYFILYLILVSTFVIFLLLFSRNKRRRPKEASPP